MASKPNIRSIRFSDDLAELIDRQVGKSFNEKFENLVTKCVWELPQKKAELKDIEERIQQQWTLFYKLRDKRQKLEQTMEGLQRELDRRLREIEGL